MTRAMVAVLLLLLGGPGRAEEGLGPITLADLDAYKAALANQPDSDAASVTFRDLWDHPARHAGRRVRVEGKLARRFRQDRVGEFPALSEAWIVNPAGDPTCLVYPDDPGGPGPEVGAEVRFAGTFLRKIRYRGGDEARLAPLIVGPAPPAPAHRPPEGLRWPGSAADWTVGLVGSALVLLVLLRRHLAGPGPGPAILEPPPRFIDGDEEAEGADHGDD